MVASSLRVVSNRGDSDDRVDSNAETLARAVRSWNAGDLAGYLQLYGDDVRVFGFGPEPMDKPTLTAFYETVWSTLGEAGRANPVLTIHEGAADGDLFACRLTLSGIHRGSFLGVAPTQRPYLLHGITMMRFLHGRVVERWTCEDMFGLLIQLGALEAPEA